MAIDTLAKKWSIKDTLATWRGPPIPEGIGVSEEDRLHYLGLYVGITLAGPATIVSIEKTRGTFGRKSHSHERHSTQSDSGANLTVSTPIGNVRRILLVTVKYTANVTANVTITLNSGAGTDRDTLLNTIALSAGTDGKYVPAAPLIISPDDTIDVFAPLLASQTSSVAIYSEIWA